MEKRCMICDEVIDEDYGKLRGTLLKVRDENHQNYFIPVCNQCQKQENWIEKAKVKGA
ncbi:hypothetical protein J4429_06280 [Candidatus Pacearchaeota archaeon]|nr:hypothetical protein [Candidatus Pacearchaeota archaeon]